MSTERINPLLDKVRMPGSTFRLPSGGEFYKDQEVEFERGKPEVYVAPMTTMDEIAITSVDKLLNGTAVEEVFARCIPSVRNVKRMLSSDVDYLLVALRVVSFGQHTDVTYNHKCSPEAKEHTYSVNVETSILDKTKQLSQSQLEQYSTTLSTGLQVLFTPLTYGGLLQVQEKLEKIRTLSDMYDATTQEEDKRHYSDLMQAAAHDYFITLMSNTVKSMDGIDDRDMIGEALSSMALPLREQMFDAQNRLEEWGQPNTVKIQCKDCKKEADVPLDLNPVSFFTKRSRQKTTS